MGAQQCLQSCAVLGFRQMFALDDVIGIHDVVGDWSLAIRVIQYHTSRLVVSLKFFPQIRLRVELIM